MEQNKGFWYADWSFPIFVGLLSSGVFAGTHMYYLYGIGAFNEVAFVAMLKAGSTRIHVGEGNVLEFATGPGFFKVEQDRALALVDDAVDSREIDAERAHQQLEEAKAELERVEAGESEADRWQLEQRIRHAENQLSVSGRA